MIVSFYELGMVTEEESQKPFAGSEVATAEQAKARSG